MLNNLIEFLTCGGWWHVDQNGLKPNRRGMVCVQGLVTYYDATEDTGGFAVLPGSQRDFEAISKRSPTAKALNDFVHIEKTDPLLQRSEGFIPEAKAGGKKKRNCQCPQGNATRLRD